MSLSDESVDLKGEEVCQGEQTATSLSDESVDLKFPGSSRGLDGKVAL